MNMKNLLVVVSAMALATSAAAQSQPSLTELAKAERARRSKVQKAGGAAKTYTESDRTGGAAVAEGESTTASTATGTAAAPGSATKKKDKTPEEIAADQQKEWNDKVKAAQDQIKETEATIARNERVLASLINITPQRVDLANSIEADKKKLAELQKSLVDLEDQRRRAGMPRPR